MDDLDRILHNPVSRRAFLARMSAAGLGGAAATLLAGCGGGGGNVLGMGDKPATPFTSPDFPGISGRNINEVVLNYALSLEILEADLYRQALNLASGRAASAPLDSAAPAAGSTGNYRQAVPNGTVDARLAAAGFLYLVQFAYVEAAHRDFLRTAIRSGGGTPVSANPGGYTFGPLAPAGNTLTDILASILPLEETGVRAYLGAAGYLTDLNLTTTAAAIYSTEARHSAAVSYIVNGGDPGPKRMTGDREVTANPPSERTFEKFLTPTTVLNTVKSFLR